MGWKDSYKLEQSWIPYVGLNKFLYDIEDEDYGALFCSLIVLMRQKDNTATMNKKALTAVFRLVTKFDPAANSLFLALTNRPRQFLG